MSNKVTELAIDWLNCWEETPFIRKRSGKVERKGILKSGVLRALPDLLFNDMMELLTPKLKGAIKRNLDSFYTMEEALQDCRERIYFHVLGSWDISKREDFERHACMCCDSWTRTVIRNIRNRNEKNKLLGEPFLDEWEPSDGGPIDPSTGVPKTPEHYVAELPADIQKIAMFLVENYHLSTSELRKAALEEFQCTHEDYVNLVKSVQNYYLKGCIA